MLLDIKNKHPRDDYISFQEEGHIYTITGKNNRPISVTTLIGKYWEKFDAEKVSGFIVKSKKMLDPDYKYYGMTQQEIINLWLSNNAAQLGTDMHYAIELYYNEVLEKYPDTKEFNFFLDYDRKFKIVNPSYKKYRTEWLVFDGILPDEINNAKNENTEKGNNENKKEIDNFMRPNHNSTTNKKDIGYGNISGSIDMTYINEAGQIVIFDWKRVKDLDKCYKYKNGDYKMGKGILSHLKDTKFNHYSLQLNVYRHILETWYDKEVVGMYLAIFHPDNDSFQTKKVERMDNEIKLLFDSVYNNI